MGAGVRFVYLGISPHTVDTHWRKLKNQKFDEIDRLDVIHHVWRHILDIRLAEERAKWEARLAEVTGGRGQQADGRNGEAMPPPQASPLPENRQLPPP